MSKKKRWGSPYQDNRDWKIYNEIWVKRGEFYLSLDFIKQWEAHLTSMNRGKRGHLLVYPSLFIDWMAYIHIFLQMPYRQIERFTRILLIFISNLQSADYNTLFRRIKLLNLSLNVNSELLSRDVIVAVDSTGIKITNRGKWMREKWKVRRGWIKVHAMVEVESNQILRPDVTDELVQDEQVFKPILDQATMCSKEMKIQQVLGMEHTIGTIFSTLWISMKFDRVSKSELMQAEVSWICISSGMSP